MSWNHRVMKDKEGFHSIREVYYKKDNKTVEMWTEEMMTPYGETPEEVKEELEQYLSAFNKPVLDEVELEKDIND